MAFRFRAVHEADAELTLAWRTKERVQRNVITRVDQSVAEQVSWLRALATSQRYTHWIVESGGAPFCYVAIHDFEADTRQLTWGYWIGEESMLGFGAMIPPMLYNFLFEDTVVERIEARVLLRNEAVLRMHVSMGYEAQEQLSVETAGGPGTLAVLWLHRRTWIDEGNRLRRLRATFEDPVPAALLARIRR